MRGKNRNRSYKYHASAMHRYGLEAERIDPLFNDAFIRIFGEQESRGVTRSLVNALLTRVGIEPIDEIDPISAEHTSVIGSIECKTPRMDVCIVSANRFIDLEAQCYPEDIDNRSLFYGAQLIASNMFKGREYNDLPQAIVITLLSDEPRFPDADDFEHVCRLGWRSSNSCNVGVGTDRLIFVLVELRKIRERYNNLEAALLGDEAIVWSYLLTQGYHDDLEVDAIMEEFPSMEEFAERYGYAINDPKVVQAYKDFESAEREYNSRQRYFARKEREAVERGFSRGVEQGIETGIERGIEQGIQQGIEQGIEQGVELGIDQGVELGVEALAERLREEGIDEALLQRAIKALEEDSLK